MGKKLFVLWKEKKSKSNKNYGQSKLKINIKLVEHSFLMYINHMGLISEQLFKALITYNTMKLRFKSTFIF